VPLVEKICSQLFINQLVSCTYVPKARIKHSVINVSLVPTVTREQSDYFVVRRQKISLVDLYIPNSSSSYWFW
jgi:hypothetical protein